MKYKVIFLDRDGVINKPAPPHDYIKSWEEFEFLPGAIEGLKILYDLGYKLVIVTNQRGIARGMLSWDKLNEIHNKMQEVLKENGVIIDHIFVCPHDENDNCDCRKPKDGLLRKIEEYYEVDKENSYMIGDLESDIEAGKVYGVKTVYIRIEDISETDYYFSTLKNFIKSLYKDLCHE